MEKISELCPIHKIEAEFFCLHSQCRKETTRSICSSCYKYGPHKFHDKINLSDLEQNCTPKINLYTQKQSEQLQNDLKILKEYQNSLPETFSKIQEKMLSAFKTVMDKLQSQIERVHQQIEKNQKTLDDLQKTNFQKINKERQDDLQKLLTDKKAIIAYSDLFTQYYDEFIQNVEIIASQWTFGLHEYFSNFDKSLEQQMRAKNKQADDELKNFNLEEFKGTKQMSLKGHEEQIFDCILLPNLYGDNTDLILSSSGDHTLKLWDVQKKKCIKTLEDPDESAIIYCMVKITEKKFAYGSTEMKIRVFDWFEEVGVLEGHENDVNALVRVDNNRILSASEDHTIRLWDIVEFKCLRIFKGHTEGIDLNRLVALDINTFISTSHDHTIKLWDINEEKELLNINLKDFQMNEITSMTAFDKNRIIAGHFETLVLWDISTQKIIYREDQAHETNIIRIQAIDPDLFATGSDCEIIKLWKIREIDDNFSIKCVRTISGKHKEVSVRVVMRFDSQRLISAGADDKIIIWQ